MKVLMLVQADHGSSDFQTLYNEMGKGFDFFDLRWLTSKEQKNLKRYFEEEVVISNYDRIVCVIRFKKEIKQVAFLRKLQNLVFLEYDACQNYMMSSKYRGVFSRHYKKIPRARVISSGFTVSEKLKKEGIDAVFVPKGYDDSVIYDLNKKRDIELGFVGSIRSKTYIERRLFLEDLAKDEGLRIEKTKPGIPYNIMLNRIKYFISADIGIGEYMQKNIEAMAAGCIVFAYDQGDLENKALGLVDMHNVVLYKNKDDLLARIRTIKGDSYLASRIVDNAKELATLYTYRNISKMFFDRVNEELVEPKRMSILQKFFS